MKTCILHIGMHKTGSSSIQYFLNENNHRLGDGVIYADMGPSNHSGPFLYALKDDPLARENIRRQYLSSDELKTRVFKFKKKLLVNLKKDYRTIIFSGEGTVFLDESELINFKKLLLLHVNEIKIFAYVRAPIEFMQSAFQQRCKNSVLELDAKELYPGYQKRFEKFEKVFGNVQYKFFDKQSLFQGDVIQDFCQHFSLPYTPTKKINESLSLLAIKFLYHFQRKRKTDKILNRNVVLLEQSLSVLDSNKLLLPNKIVEKVFDEHSADIRWIKRRVPELRSQINRSNDRPKNKIDWHIVNKEEYSQLIKLNENEALSQFVAAECNMTLVELIAAAFKSHGR